MDSVIIALELLGYGLGGTFLSLILLYGVILLTRRLFRPKTEEKAE